MKKLSLFALAAAGLLLGACSDKDAVSEISTNPVGELKDGAFIGLTLQLPNASGATRANDDLNNGTEDEFAVNNATLYIFKAAKNAAEGTATFVDYVAMGTGFEADTEGKGHNGEGGGIPGAPTTQTIDTKITSTLNEATQLPLDLANTIKSDTENDYYAYVILNHNGQLTNIAKDMTFADFSNKTFAEIGADIALEANIHDGGLLMTNAPICDKAGGNDAPAEGAKYTTLVKIDNSMIFDTANEALANPAGCVYVERAAAKITVVDGRADADKKIGNATVTFDGWKVINTEPEYYNTRHIESAWGALFSQYHPSASGNTKYRFVSKYQFEPTIGNDPHTVGFRTYFAKDVNWDKAEPTLSFTTADDERPWIEGGHHAYTTENTFTVANQNWKNTTMVTVKATIEGGSFYTVGKGSQTMFTTLDDVKAAIQNIIKNDPEVTGYYQQLLDKISENNRNKTVNAGLNVIINNDEALTASKTGVPFTVELAFTITTPAEGETPASTVAADYNGDGEGAIKAKLVAAIEKVIYKQEEATSSDTPSPARFTRADGDTEKEYNDAVLVSFYNGGVMYYNARIQHFGEAETPWNGADVTGAGITTAEIYAVKEGQSQDGNYLGRYGVVRDNWYILSVDKIGKIGTAEPVDPSTTTPDTPDDEIEKFISVHVHIVPWVLREQSVKF